MSVHLCNGKDLRGYKPVLGDTGATCGSMRNCSKGECNVDRIYSNVVRIWASYEGRVTTGSVR